MRHFLAIKSYEHLLHAIKVGIDQINLPQKFIAESMGFTRSTLHRKLTGETPMTVVELLRIQEYSGVRIAADGDTKETSLALIDGPEKGES